MNYLKLIVSIIICQAAGLIGSVFTAPSIQTWYVGLNKPFFVPPNWLFAPAWTTLFLLMGISLYLVWNKGLKEQKNRCAIKIFGIQLVLNIVWSVIFFGLQSPLYAFIEIIILWIAILGTIIKFHRVDKKAAYLLIPYILWVTFAAALNLAVYLLNAA
ncbi:MAG: TspO/MBR family protein [Candidatus Aenigmatarchaeota archaeon]|nr:tryptophan-rich sensory protein [Nanoarchaeota archaeon]